MGFLSNLTRNMTGDWADVALAVGDAERGGVVAATIDVTVKGDAISVAGILLEIRCEEVVDFPSERVQGATVTGGLTETTTLFDQSVDATGPQELAAGSQQSLPVQIAIPSDQPPSFSGRHARVQWSARARIDMKGNDPDSGWQHLQVR